MKILTALSIIAILAVACSGSPRKTATETASSVPAAQSIISEISADSLLSFVNGQTSIGPRNPGSQGHANCIAYITSRLKSYNIDSITIGNEPVTTSTGETFKARNIFASINPGASSRIILLAHYDTRPWADNDPDPTHHTTPIIGANDGASGVAVLLEMARLLPQHLPDTIGVDLLFTDLEDSGKSDVPNPDSSWCLGSQQFAKNLPYHPDNTPRFGILLDMVGGKGARFHREYFSDLNARQIVDRVWSQASALGLSDRFLNSRGGAVVDDHRPLQQAGIPCIDIIESINPATGSFNPTWHTTGDTFEEIDGTTLADVAKVVAATIINFKP